jgi:endonuclease YncB( thermonuclease family)
VADPYCYMAKVVRILDGDSISAVLDLGFHMNMGPVVARLTGLNTPELRDKDPEIRKRAVEAKEFVSSRLLPADPALTPKVKVDSKELDKYGRPLTVVWYLPPQRTRWINLNDELLTSGLAKPYSGDGEKPV